MPLSGLGCRCVQVPRFEQTRGRDTSPSSMRASEDTSMHGGFIICQLQVEICRRHVVSIISGRFLLEKYTSKAKHNETRVSGMMWLSNAQVENHPRAVR